MEVSPIFFNLMVDETEIHSISNLPETSQPLGVRMGNNPWSYSEVTLCCTASVYSGTTLGNSVFPIMRQRRICYLIMIFFLLKMTSWAVFWLYVLYKHKIGFKIMWLTLLNCHTHYNWWVFYISFFLPFRLNVHLCSFFHFVNYAWMSTVYSKQNFVLLLWEKL